VLLRFKCKHVSEPLQANEGTRSFTSNRLYQFETKIALFLRGQIIVLASSLTGVVIGMTVSFTMVMQENVLLGKDLQLFFPLSQFVVILVLSIICAFMATYVPAS